MFFHTQESTVEIKGTFNFAVGKTQLPANQAKDGQQMYVDGELKVTPDRAKDTFGDAFFYVAFGTMHKATSPGANEDGDATEIRFGYGSKKPPKWLTPALHHVDLWGNKQKTQPIIQRIVAGANEEAVTLKVRFVFDTNRDEALIGSLGAKSGTTAKIKLRPVQTAALQTAAQAA